MRVLHGRSRDVPAVKTGGLARRHRRSRRRKLPRLDTRVAAARVSGDPATGFQDPPGGGQQGAFAGRMTLFGHF